MRFRSWIPQPKQTPPVVQHRHCIATNATDDCPVCTGEGESLIEGHKELYCLDCDVYWTSGQPIDSKIKERIARRKDQETNARDRMMRIMQSLRITHSWMNY